MYNRSELLFAYLRLAIIVGILYFPSYLFYSYASLKLLVVMIIVGGAYQSINGGVLKKGILSALAGGAIVALYYMVGMDVVYLASVVIGGFFAIVAAGAIIELFSPEPGRGSLLTVLIVGVPIMSALAYILLVHGLNGLGWVG